MIEVKIGETRENVKDFVKSLDVRNPAGLGLTAKGEKKFIDMLYYDDVKKIKEDNIKCQNTITNEEWIYLIENRNRLETTLELLDWKAKSSFTNWHLYNTICNINYIEKKIAEGKSINQDSYNQFLLSIYIKSLKDALNPKTVNFERPNAFLYELAKQYLDRLRPSHRPAKQHLIKMIDVETGEVFERFNNRAAVIETIGVKKARLSQCIKSSNDSPNCKTSWKKFSFEGRKYWFVEEE